MTETRWLAGDEATEMLKFLRDRASDRKYRLFAVACARDELARAKAGKGCFRFGDELDEQWTEFYWHKTSGYEAAILSAESMADGGPSRHFSAWFVGWGGSSGEIAYAALGHDPDDLVPVPPERIEATLRGYSIHPAVYLRDIIGNPFRPVAFDPACVTADAASLAQAAYDERELPSGKLDAARLGILSDALEEAGCADEVILSHLRSPGPHVRGCWALDLVLAKDR